MPERILTLHPEGKQGVNIEKKKYLQMKTAILEYLKSSEPMTIKTLGRHVDKTLQGNFEGSISWYYTTVKLDLEARGLIERIPGTSPQKIRLRRNS
jgi:hypothetical protein